jgi:uncharacterized repeat protein (TIGR02543 family)
MKKETLRVARKTGLLLTGLVLVLGMMGFAGCEPSPTPLTTAPATPAGLQVTATSSTSITISWTAVTGAVSYKVYRSAIKEGTYEAVDNPVDTSSIDTGLQPNTTYWYKVTALNADGESGQSIAKSATTPDGDGVVAYSITYYANGASGTVPSAQTVAANTIVNAAWQGALTYEGKTFTGWNTKADGTGASYAAGSSLTVTGDVTLYAQWKNDTSISTPEFPVPAGHPFYPIDITQCDSVDSISLNTMKPVLDETKIPVATRYHTIETTNFTTSYGTSLRELSQKRAISLGAEVKAGMFSASLKATDTKELLTNETSSYGEGTAIHKLGRISLQNGTPEYLRTILDASFVQYVATHTGKEVIDMYGTSIPISVLVGGSMNFRFDITSKEIQTTSDFTTAVEAMYSRISANAGTSYQDKARELIENSSFKYSTNGGALTGFLSFEQLTADYQRWVSSIGASPVISGIEKFDWLVPLYELISDPVKKASAQAEYEAKITAAGLLIPGEMKHVGPIPFSTPGNVNYSPLISVPCIVEVYVQGAGGSGTGGSWNTDGVNGNIKRGVGGAGGSGAAVYAKLYNAGGSFNIQGRIGSGKAGGAFKSRKAALFTEPSLELGDSGKDGEDSSLTLAGKTIRAGGGKGGNGITGGGGGTFDPLYTDVILIEIEQIRGKSGSTGANDNSNHPSKGGMAPSELDKIGSISDFNKAASAGEKPQGQSEGGVLDGSYGGGGAGGFCNNSGSVRLNGGKGGDGHALIYISYFEYE